MIQKTKVSFPLQSKLLVGYGVVCVLVVSVVVFGYKTAYDTSLLLEKSIREDVIPLVDVIRLQEKTNKIRVLEGELTQSNDIFNVTGTAADLKQQIHDLGADLEIFLEDHVSVDQAKKRVVRNRFENYLRAVLQTVEFAENNQLEKASANFRFTSSPRFLLLIDDLEEISLAVKTRAEEKHAGLASDLHLKRNVYLYISIFLVCSGFILVYSLASSLTRRLLALRKGALAFASGHFNHRLEITGNDEITDLARSFNQMQDSIQQKIDELSRLNEKITLQNKELNTHRDHLEELVQQRSKELVESEKQLRHFQKMESLGTLAGGISHDFNNLLHGIMGYANLLQVGDLPPATEREYLTQITRIAGRGSELVKRIMAFSRMTDITLDTYDLVDIVNDSLILLERTVPKEIGLVRIFSPAAINVMVDHALMEQVIVNIANNSVDAMKNGGTITVSIEERDVEGLPAVSPGRYAVVAITDTGTGMDEQTMKRVFDPFFTTKEIGRGTGLGLSSAYGIVSSFGGFLNCKSALREGSTFYIYLPVAQKDQVPVDEQKVTTTGEEYGVGETVLIVDDEEAIRVATERIFSQRGYRVLTADDGAAALAMLHERKNQIDLIVSDLGMPGMSGTSLVASMKAEAPDIPIVVCTGHLDHEILQAPEKHGVAAALAKPLNYSVLTETVLQILQQ